MTCYQQVGCYYREFTVGHQKILRELNFITLVSPFLSKTILCTTSLTEYTQGPLKNLSLSFTANYERGFKIVDEECHTGVTAALRISKLASKTCYSKEIRRIVHAPCEEVTQDAGPIGLIPN